ncbi:hypothetical protein HOG47_02510 [archaeon]|nr:hypothetical protein [archaeon]
MKEYLGGLSKIIMKIFISQIDPPPSNIRKNKIELSSSDFCSLSAVVADFSEYGNLKSYEDGNITFSWSAGANGNSNRWHAEIIFGENLSKSETEEVSCSGLLHNWIFRLDKAKKSKKYMKILNDVMYTPNTIFAVCAHDPIEVNQSHGGITHNYTLAFDTFQKATKIWIDNKYEGEFFDCNSGGEEVNSIGFTLVNNQAPNTQTYSIIDNLVVNLNEKEEEKSIHPLLKKFAPVFVHHPEEIFPLNSIESMLNQSNLSKGLFNDVIKESPLIREDINNKSDRTLNLDLNNVEVNNIKDLPNPDDFTSFEKKVYGRITQDQNNYSYLQYFTFFPFQDWYTTHHEGDWQLVQMTINDIGEIEDISYFFNYLFTETYYDLDFIDRIEGHPLAYVSKGSHNMYGSDDVFYPYLDKLNKSQRFWAELSWGLKPLDKISKEGPKFVPKDSNISGTEYEIEQIYDNTGWINYEGLWGERHVYPHRSGQRGPKFNSRYELEWMIPGRYTYGYELPFMAVMLNSPLDIYLYDSDNQLKDFLFYTGSEYEPEIILTTNSSPTKLILNATNKGMFNLSVFFFDGIDGIILKYNEINNTATTLGVLNVSNISDFLLCLDFEPDGIFDKCYYPNEFLLHNDYDYEIPDQDLDFVGDKIDNCPTIFNPNQEDFNENNLGDVCDNPQYYKSLAKEKSQKSFVKKHIKFSLKQRFWKDEFRIKTPVVFVLEIVASKKATKEVKKLLAKADQLIVEYRLKDINPDKIPRKWKKRFDLSQKYFSFGNKMFDKEKYSLAIKYYMRSWFYLQNL